VTFTFEPAPSERLLNSDVKYRFAIDMASLESA